MKEKMSEKGQEENKELACSKQTKQHSP